MRLIEAMPMGESGEAQMVWLQVDPIDGESQTYLIIVSHAAGEQAIQLLTDSPQAIVARLKLSDGDSEDESRSPIRCDGPQMLPVTRPWGKTSLCRSCIPLPVVEASKDLPGN